MQTDSVTALRYRASLFELFIDAIFVLFALGYLSFCIICAPPYWLYFGFGIGAVLLFFGLKLYSATRLEVRLEQRGITFIRPMGRRCFYRWYELVDAKRSKFPAGYLCLRFSDGNVFRIPSLLERFRGLGEFLTERELLARMAVPIIRVWRKRVIRSGLLLAIFYAAFSPRIVASMLVSASFFGKLGPARVILVLGYDPNRCNTQGVSPLVAAVTGGHREIVVVLRRFGARPIPDQRGRDPIAIARAQGRMDLSRLLDGA